MYYIMFVISSRAYFHSSFHEFFFLFFEKVRKGGRAGVGYCAHGEAGPSEARRSVSEWAARGAHAAT